jgi:hypothetical protein
MTHLTKVDEVQELFQTYQIDSKEDLSGQQINEFQRAYLHNLRASYAEQKLNLAFTPDAIITFAQAEAELRGKIDLLSDLLAPIEITTDESKEN